jgi:CRISPR/Cas system-associated exonuclease Cas4 (RecB family)
VPNQQDDQLTEVIAQTSLSSVKKMELGTRVHRALELNDLSLLQAIHDEGLLDTRALQEWASHDPWFLNAERTWNECAFEVRLVTGEILVGAVDRLMFAPSLSPSRPYQIFDFKVSQKESDVLTQQKLLDRYQLQLQLYELALQRVEPSLKGKMQSALIQINSQGVLKVEVPSSEVSLLDDFAIQAHDLIAGKKLPKTNVAQHCRYCSYRSICRDYEKAKISHDKSLT